ncbi:MAG: hypothetical protein Q9217_002148 [Psora testacea]
MLDVSGRLAGAGAKRHLAARGDARDKRLLGPSGALDRMPRDLEAHTEGAETYRSLLRDKPGIAFQHVAPSSGTNHYQLRVIVDARSFGPDAKSLCRAHTLRGCGVSTSCLDSFDGSGGKPLLKALGRAQVLDRLSPQRALVETRMELGRHGHRRTRRACKDRWDRISPFITRRRILPDHQRVLYLDESVSSASVALVLGCNGEAEVHRTCSHDGVDGNGRPWLERQLLFLGSSVAMRETGILLKPPRHRVGEGTVSIAFPYVSSHSLAEMALAGMDADALLAILDDLLGEIAACVWPKSAVPGPDDYIEQAHFSRMRRRVATARAAVPELDDITS